MARTPATVTVELATGELTGLFVLDSSLLDGDDALAGEFGEAGSAFFDLTGRDQAISITRGAPADLAAINPGRTTVVVTDEDGDFNPENPASPIIDTLDVMLPLRIRGTHPDLFESYRDTVLADEPAGYWRLGEASGALARDSSGNGLDGTYTGGVTLGQTGALSGDADTAALFNGSTGYVLTPLTINPLAGFTVEAWVKLTALTGVSQIVTAQQDGAGTGRSVLYVDGPTGMWASNVGGVVLVSATPPSTTAYQHVAITNDGATSRIYVNAIEVTNGARVPNSATGAWLIGTSKVLSLFTSGTLDEVAIYPTALSAARILAHYEAGTATGGDPRTAGLYYGFLRDYEHDPDWNVRKSTLWGIDFFEWLGTIKPVIASAGPVSEGEAIGLILDYAEWTDPTLRDLDDGGTLADFSADGTQSAIELIRGIQQVGLGLFFVKGDGVVRYRGRENRFAPQSPVATLDGSLISGVKPRRSVDQVRNRIVVTRTGGTPQEASDDESRRKYGWRDGDPISSDYFVSDSDALSLAQLYVLFYGRPREPIKQIELVNRDDESILLQLTLEIGDRVVVQESTGGTDAEGEIVGIQHRWVPGGEWRTRYLVSTIASSVQFFVLDDDTGAGVLDGDAVLAY